MNTSSQGLLRASVQFEETKNISPTDLTMLVQDPATLLIERVLRDTTILFLLNLI